MDKWQMMDVLMNMRGFAVDMMTKHRIKDGEKNHCWERWDAWNALEDKLHDKWKRLYNEDVIERGLPARCLIM